MFDPLDLYSALQDATSDYHADLPIEGLKDSASENTIGSDNNYNYGEQEGSVIDVLDLPSARYASPESVLCVLLLLKPDNQVNFCSLSSDNDVPSVSNICSEKGIDQDMLDNLVNYYETWENSRLNSKIKVCTMIPTLNASSKELLLKYYTSLLKFYQESSEHHPIYDEITKQLSMRISEKCGRSALPAMSRKFTFQKLNTAIEIFEPSLTADNLGWKTWGSSFILSQKLVDSMVPSNTDHKLRVLELGSGTGLAGISWISKWIEINGNRSIDMFLTDLPEIVPNLQKNVEANALSDFVTVSVLDWTNPKSFEEKYTDKKFDIIIVSDPIYSPNHPKLVVDILVNFLSISGVCYLEIPVREKYAKERETLWQLLKANKLSLTRQELAQGMEDWGMVKYLYQEIRW